MKGLDKFIKEINEEVEKIKDNKKKELFKLQATELIKHLTDVCDKEYDDLLAQDHKSFRRMWKYVINNAKEYEVNGVAMVPDPVTYGWMDTYVGLDDKKDVEKELKEKEKNSSKTFDVKKQIEETRRKINDETQASIFDLM